MEWVNKHVENKLLEDQSDDDETEEDVLATARGGMGPVKKRAV